MRTVLRTILLTALLASAIRAAEAPPAVPQALRPFAPLVGTTWVATFPNGKLTDEQKFEWVYGGKFLRNQHWVRTTDGKTVYEGETIYAWDPLAEQVVWWYWNASGGYVAGTMSATEGGWLFEGVNHAPKTQTPKVRGVIRAITAESWESVQYFERDGKWVEQFAIVYRPPKAK